jgi:hypothetical protein
MVWNGEIRLSDLPSMQAASAIKQYAMAQGVTYVDDITGRTNKITFGAGLPSLETAIDIMRGQSPDAALNGHKVRSFYNNILAQSHSGGSVTIDVHAVSAAVGQAISSQDKRMVVMQSPKTTAYSAKGVYSLFADAYRKVAKDHNLSPEQVQAIVWLQWRANN